MSAIGDPSLWRDQVVTVYDLVHGGIEAVWPACRSSISSAGTVAQVKDAARRKKVARRRLEDPITRNLVRHLRLVPALRGRFHIVSQFELINNDLTQDPDAYGYVDVAILFSVGLNEVCLFIECKRLNVKGASLAREYVSEGMMRFVTGKYAPDQPLGVMIGYVMDGRLPEASDAVIQQIRSRLTELCCAGSSISFISMPSHFSTLHDRNPNAIELRHQLLAAVP